MQMVETDQYCADIATQISAAQGLLKEANRQLLKNHLACCGKTKLMSKDSGEVDNFIEELVRVRDVSTRK
ncbi:MAG: metal-sensing transcriptional repressor [bacterium]